MKKGFKIFSGICSICAIIILILIFLAQSDINDTNVGSVDYKSKMYSKSLVMTLYGVSLVST